jgi:hypothetical protein
VWLPQSAFDAFPALALLRAAVWVVSCVALVALVARRHRYAAA